MRISTTTTILVESPDGAATFTIRKLPLNLLHELQAKARAEDSAGIVAAFQSFTEAVLRNVVSVTGLVDERDSAVDVKALNALDVDADTAYVIANAYLAAHAAKSGSLDQEKKEQPAA